ncbi:unnamed protein product [Durusdinium trenchii]|uniref:Pentatricopeptide repeat-containing protein, chloroplastic n=1 Tax=Durusdinium trenchii TaxID=1381693 RepID=A0ABP0SW12_9DINO
MPRERRHLTSASRWKVGLLGLVLCAPVGPNFFTFDESKPKDPGRRELRHEFSGVGEERLLLPLSCGGTLSVRGYEASEQQVPKGWPSGSYQEWRSLIFEPAETEDAGPPFIQSVSKVTCCPDGRWFPEADPQVLALNYPKTLGAAVAASLKLLHVERPKILVIGLGSSAVPLWLAELFPDSQVDVVELEGTVIQAASEVLGFPIEVPGAGDRNLSPLRGRMGQRLRAIEGDGAALAQRWAADKGTRYDAVLIDAYDSLNRVPQPLWIEDGPLAQALPRLLEEVGVVAANVPPGFPTLRLIASYLQALGTDAQETPALTFEVPETMNTVAVVLRGAQVDVPLIALQEEAKKLVEDEIRSPHRPTASASDAIARLPLAQQSWQDAVFWLRKWSRDVAFLELQGRRKQLPSLATYTSVMSACTRQSQWQLSITVIDRLRGQQLRPDLVAQNAELWAFAKGLQWPLVLQGLQRLSTAACSSSFGALIDLFAKGSQWQRALNLFQTQKGLQEDLVTFNLLLNACEKSSNWTIALSLLEEMPRRLVRPDVISLNTTLSSLAAVAQWRRALHLWATRRGASDERIQPTVITMNSLMIACSAAFHWEQAIHLWQGLTPYVGTSEATYGVLMETLGAPGCDWCHSVSLLESSLRQSLCNVVTFTSVLKILSTARRWQQALALFQQMIQREVTPNLLTVHVAPGRGLFGPSQSSQRSDSKGSSTVLRRKASC